MALKPKMYFMVLKQLFDATNIASSVAGMAGYDVPVPQWVRTASGDLKTESDAHMNERMAGDMEFHGQPAVRAYAAAMRRMRVMAPERDFSAADVQRAHAHILHGSR